MNRLIGLVVLVLFLSGCSSLLYRSDPNAPANTGVSRGLYPGVRSDMRILLHPDQIELMMTPITQLWVLIDLPGSLAVDTLYLPFDTAYFIANK